MAIQNFNSLNKIIINFHQSFDEMKNDILEKNSKFLGNQATLRDLKNLEDDFITKLDELYNSINDKFAEKNLILRNNKAMELKMKRIVEDSKKNEKSDSWLLSKMPIGHLCASCESYLGDIKDTANTKYVPWNKYPTKENADKLYRVGAGYSRMLQMISPDTKNKTKVSNNSNNYESLSPIGIGSRQDIIEDMNEISKSNYEPQFKVGDYAKSFAVDTKLRITKFLGYKDSSDASFNILAYGVAVYPI